MRVALKFSYIIALVGFFLVVSLTVALFLPERRLRRLRLHFTSFICRRMLGGFDIQVKYVGFHRYKMSKHLIVSNHLSYLDVLVIFARYPAVFITSNEVRDSGLLGLCCKAAGCIFVERRSRSLITTEVKRIAGYLEERFPVALFPEATTSNGSAMLPFRKSLLKAAEVANSDVIPFCINYLTVDGEPLGQENRDSIYYYGEMTFFPTFFAY